MSHSLQQLIDQNPDKLFECVHPELGTKKFNCVIDGKAYFDGDENGHNMSVTGWDLIEKDLETYRIQKIIEIDVKTAMLIVGGVNYDGQAFSSSRMQ
jgi:hypothetical protein